MEHAPPLAVEPVQTGLPVQLVVAATAQQLVVAVPAVDAVISGAALKHVVAGAPVEVAGHGGKVRAAAAAVAAVKDDLGDGGARELRVSHCSIITSAISWYNDLAPQELAPREARSYDTGKR